MTAGLKPNREPLPPRARHVLRSISTGEQRVSEADLAELSLAFMRVPNCGSGLFMSLQAYAELCKSRRRPGRLWRQPLTVELSGDTPTFFLPDLCRLIMNEVWCEWFLSQPTQDVESYGQQLVLLRRIIEGVMTLSVGLALARPVCTRCNQAMRLAGGSYLCEPCGNLTSLPDELSS